MLTEPTQSRNRHIAEYQKDSPLNFVQSTTRSRLLAIDRLLLVLKEC